MQVLAADVDISAITTLIQCFTTLIIFEKHHHHHHHHHITVMELGHLLTHSGPTYPDVSSKVYHDSFCHLGSSVSLPHVIYFEAFYLHVVSSFSCIAVICPKFVLFLTPLQFVHLFCDLSKRILLFFSRASSLTTESQPYNCFYQEWRKCHP